MGPHTFLQVEKSKRNENESSEGGDQNAGARTIRLSFKHMDRNFPTYHLNLANVAGYSRNVIRFPVTPFSKFCFRVREVQKKFSLFGRNMCRKHLRLSWLIFLGLIYILESAKCYLTDEYDDDNTAENEDYLRLQDKMEEPPELINQVLISKREPAFTPYISIGALSNMQQFFENLKENFHSLESLSQDERNALLGKHEQSAEQETRIFRPPATAAYLHAVRNQRPSHKIRNFVANAEPPYLRGSNHYDPSYLWTGLGRRR